jgi:Zn-dependent peptidase ImmA (M78 family)
VSKPHVKVAVAAARTARSQLGLGLDGPVHDLLVVVEDLASLPVMVLRLGNGVAGAYMRRGDQSFVFLDGSEDVARQRFTLAHELGHHWLGHGSVIDGVESIETGVGDPREEQANAFAGEFLAPESALHHWMEAQDDPPLELEVVVDLAMWFTISVPAAVVRLTQADILQRPGDRRKLKTAIDRGTHKGLERQRESERAEDGLAKIAREGALPRLPRRMRESALALYAAGTISIERLAQVIRRDVETTQALVDRFGITPAPEEDDW